MESGPLPRLSSGRELLAGAGRRRGTSRGGGEGQCGGVLIRVLALALVLTLRLAHDRRGRIQGVVGDGDLGADELRAPADGPPLDRTDSGDVAIRGARGRQGGARGPDELAA